MRANSERKKYLTKKYHHRNMKVTYRFRAMIRGDCGQPWTTSLLSHRCPQPLRGQRAAVDKWRAFAILGESDSATYPPRRLTTSSLFSIRNITILLNGITAITKPGKICVVFQT